MYTQEAYYNYFCITTVVLGISVVMQIGQFIVFTCRWVSSAQHMFKQWVFKYGVWSRKRALMCENVCMFVCVCVTDGRTDGRTDPLIEM